MATFKNRHDLSSKSPPGERHGIYLHDLPCDDRSRTSIEGVGDIHVTWLWSCKVVSRAPPRDLPDHLELEGALVSLAGCCNWVGWRWCLALAGIAGSAAIDDKR